MKGAHASLGAIIQSAIVQRESSTPTHANLFADDRAVAELARHDVG